MSTVQALRRFSHSTVKGLLDDCAYKIGLERIVGLDSPGNVRTAAGTAYHAGIELHEQQRKLWRRSGGRKGDPEGVPLADALEASLLDLDRIAPKDGLTEEEKDEAGLQIEAGLHHWYDTPLPDGQEGAGGSLRDRVMQWDPIAVESRWTVWLPEHTSLPTVGAADVVYLDPDTDELVIVDQKSAGSFGKYKLDGQNQLDQGAMYGLAVMQAPELPGRRDTLPRVEFHVTRIEPGKNARFEGARNVVLELDEHAIEYAALRVGLAHDLALDGRFEKNPDSWLCSPKWCPFHIEAGGPCDPEAPPEYDLGAEAAE